MPNSSFCETTACQMFCHAKVGGTLEKEQIKSQRQKVGRRALKHAWVPPSRPRLNARVNQPTQALRQIPCPLYLFPLIRVGVRTYTWNSIRAFPSLTPIVCVLFMQAYDWLTAGSFLASSPRSHRRWHGGSFRRCAIRCPGWGPRVPEYRKRWSWFRWTSPSVSAAPQCW